MKKAFKDINFRGASLAIVEQANTIIAEFQQQGYELTLRQLYYQFVAADILANTDKNYEKLGQIVNNGRLAGMIDWDAIVDRTRSCNERATWTSAASILRSAEISFNLDKWIPQDHQVEVWVEKEAMAQIVQKAADMYDVPWFCCRGYVSQSAMYEAAQRHIGYNKPVYVLYLGDHDPSGIDMTRDIRDRLEMFHDWEVSVHRIALNMDQIEEQSPPPNPTKITDSRAKEYIALYGHECWELDALNPAYLHKLIVQEIEQYVDQEAWKEVVKTQEAQRDVIRKARESIK